MTICKGKTVKNWPRHENMKFHVFDTSAKHMNLNLNFRAHQGGLAQSDLKTGKSGLKEQ